MRRNRVPFQPFLLTLILIIYTTSMSPQATATTEQSPIYINADLGFASGGFPGSGTKEDPYLIENLRITTNALTRNGIEIRNTGAFFVIRNCAINASYIGILVENVSPGTTSIIGNVIEGITEDGGGIVLGADGVTVTNNTCTGFIDGVHTNYSDSCTFTYNNFSNNIYHGISLRYSNDNYVAHNTIKGNGVHGVFIIRSSTGNTMTNNTLSGNSRIESYNWDDIYHFTVKSQGLDEGQGNHWYVEETHTGNRWSDYSGKGEYLIDGSAKTVDRYPASTVTTPNTPMEPSEDTGVKGIPWLRTQDILLGVTAGILVIGLSTCTARRNNGST
jgi:parallel beta-helix repeat protein